MNNTHRAPLADLLKPSYFSAALAIMAGLIVAVGVIISFEVNNSVVQQQLRSWELHTSKQHTLTTPDQILPQNDHPTLQGSWPLIIIWGVVGLLVYALVMVMIRGFSNAKELSQEVTYVNAKPGKQLTAAFEHLAVRFVAAAIFIGLTGLLIKQVLPYSITAANAAADDLLSGYGALYTFISFAVVVATLHLQTIFLRLTFGKVRVF